MSSFFSFTTPTPPQTRTTTTTRTTTSSFFQPNTTDFSDIIDPKCRSYYTNNSGIGIIKDYEGIPENLIVNLCAWFGLLVLFTFLRRIGDYGRFGLLKNDEERRLLEPKNSRYNLWSAKFFSKISLEEDLTNENEQQQNQTQSRQAPNILNHSHSSLSNDFTHTNEYKETNFFSWIIHMIKLKDKHINEKCGRDAIYYLVFQRYLIVYLLIVTILSISVLLPINLHGTALANTKIFSSTTIINILPNSAVLWVHLVLSWLFFIFGIIFMRHFSKKMEYTEAEYVSRTVLITQYPNEYSNPDYIRKHFDEAYPELIITDIQFAYDVSKLNKLDQRRRAMHIGRVTSEKIYEQTQQRPMMHPFHFGSLVELCCCCCGRFFKNNEKRLTDSINYYTKYESELSQKIAENREKVLKKPLGILFVTFQDQKMAETFLKNYRYGFFATLFLSSCTKSNCAKCYLCQNLPRISSVSNKLESDYWSVKYAPCPNNIKWENISKIGPVWWLRYILINMVLIILMIFFTTPSILIEKFSSWNQLFDFHSLEKIFPSYIAEFLPSLILRLLAALLPVLVAQTALAELHWTRSAENRSMMVKTFTLLLFMVLILPTLGLTSINALFEWLNNKKEDSLIKWRCISDNGAFFLKYVTTCSLIGTALDLLRLPELFLYVLRMIWSRSSAERLAVRMKAAFEFDYGVQYAWLLTVFTVTLCFSVVCPLITPFGLVYLILKHLVDRFNIYFAYVSTKVDKSIHKSAVKFTLASFIMLQFCILFFIAVKNKKQGKDKNENTDAIATVQTIVLIISCIIFFGRLFFGLFKKFTPFNFDKKNTLNENNNTNQETNEADYSYIIDSANSSSSSSSYGSELIDIDQIQINQPISSLDDEAINLSKNQAQTNKIRSKKDVKQKSIILNSPYISSIIRASLKQEINQQTPSRPSSVLDHNEVNIELPNSGSNNYGSLFQQADRTDLSKSSVNHGFETEN